MKRKNSKPEESTTINFRQLAVRAKECGLTKAQTMAFLKDVKRSLLSQHEPPRSREEAIANTTIIIALLFQDGSMTVKADGLDPNQWQWSAV